jgi:hypothetical protein
LNNTTEADIRFKYANGFVIMVNHAKASKTIGILKPNVGLGGVIQYFVIVTGIVQKRHNIFSRSFHISNSYTRGLTAKVNPASLTTA